MAASMSDLFQLKAQGIWPDFSGFPRATHPAWKGFPVLKWKKELESLSWSNSEFGDLNINSWSDAVPFSLENFSVLLIQGQNFAWVKNEIPGVQISRLQEENSVQKESGDEFRKLVFERSAPGLHLEWSKGFKAPRPILVLSSGPEGSKQWSVFRHRISMAPLSEGRMILVELTNQDSHSLHSQIWEGSLESQSRFHVIKAGQTSPFFSHSYFDWTLKDNSYLEHLSLDMQTQLGREEIDICLQGKGAEAQTLGVHLLGDDQLYDTRIKMDHQIFETRSQQSFKSIVADKASSLFGGHILIRQEAQRVDSSQSHKALLLSPSAKSLAFPELEVGADDVKAAHGSSTGQIDADQIFYLKSRGLSESEAIHLLSEAFVKDVLLKLTDLQMREFAEDFLSHILPDFVHRMETKWLEEK